MCFKSADIIFFIRDIYVRSQIIVSAWVLTPPVNHNPTISSVPPGTENRNKYRFAFQDLAFQRRGLVE